jgi:hypothetical protein
MNVRYLNHQDKLDPMNRAIISGAAKLAELLDTARKRSAFVAQLSADNGFQIKIGIGEKLGCAQYSRTDGEPPYLMAVSPKPPMKRGYLEFLAANTLTPIAARYIISFDEMKMIALHFVQTGQRSDAVSWQVLDPRAIKEDAERSPD